MYQRGYLDMQEALNQDSQCLNERRSLSFPAKSVKSVLTWSAIAVLTGVLGTTVTLCLAHKPPQIPESDESETSLKTVAEPPIIEPTDLESFTDILSQGNELLKKQTPIVPGLLYPIGSALEDTNLPLTISRLHRQKRQRLLNNSWRRSGLPAQTDVKRSLDQPIVPTQLSQAPDSLPPSFELTFLAEMALKLDQALQTHTVATEIPENQLKEGQPTAQAIETPSQPIHTESALTVKRVELTLSDVVVLAVENNRSIKNAYLERIAQRQDLAVAEDKFVPNFTPTLSLSTAQLDSDDNTTTNSDIGAEARVSVKIPTGGELSVGWTVNDNSTLDSNDVIDDSDDDSSGQNLDLSFNQPLLRGAGVNVNTASVKIARFTEQSNILALKSTLIDTVTDAIIAYRELLRAQERVKIDQQSLALAQETLKANQVLIEAGRLAPVDIVQSETAVANRQVSLLAAQNNLESTKLALLDILDIDQTTEIVSAEIPKAEAISLDPNNLRELAFTNRPDYLQAQLSRETAQLDLSLAEDNRRWDLSLVTSLNNRVNSTSDVRAGLRLTHDFGDLTKEQRFQRSRVNLLQAENSLEDLDESLEIQVKDGIRNVNLRLSQVELARQATELSERQLEIERQKQRLGRGDGIFELVRLQNELVDARNAELNATIDYLNALTRLDQSLGTTLDTWQVTIEKE